MPYIGRDLMKQWEKQYKYLLRIRDEHSTLRPDQQKRLDFLSPIFEKGESSYGTSQENAGT